MPGYVPHISLNGMHRDEIDIDLLLELWVGNKIIS